MRISEHFQIFLPQTFLYVKFQSSIRGEFEDCHKTFEIRFYKNRQQMMPASIINVDSFLNSPLHFSRC